jgi:hypothetical protein
LFLRSTDRTDSLRFAVRMNEEKTLSTKRFFFLRRRNITMQGFRQSRHGGRSVRHCS